MLANAIRIDTDGQATVVKLPDGTADLRSALRGILGGTPDQAVYHQRSLLWVHDNGQREGLVANLTAWTLASAWRRIPLPYQLYGTVVVTGRDDDGMSTALDDDLTSRVQAVTETVQATMAAWQQRPPASEDAALKELLAYAVRDVA
ncbi:MULTISPECIES: hypothetical protein [Streptacidiphilus]|uniref:DUF3846 domain-containing protein n=1 Tax=Streptacidiphilus cavernicola TaxID=3342716 RepID=A0ABV6UW28_9ACTN|nr:hypothetical protein [Streptacidiphilus jeojiense]